MDNGTLMMNAISYSGDGGTLVMNGKIYSGIVVKSGEGGTDVSDTTATQADVLSGKIFHIADGTKSVGTLVAPKVVQGTVTPNATTDTTVNIGFKPSAVYIMTNMGQSQYFGSGIVKADGTNIGSRYGTGSSPVASSPCVVTLQNDGFLIKSATNRYETLTYYVAIG